MNCCAKRRSGRAANPAATPFYRCNTAFGDDRDRTLCAGQRSEKILRATDGLGTEATRAGIIELLFKRGFLTKKRALYPLYRRRKSAIPFAARNGDATGHDRALGIGADANQRKAVSLSGLYAAAGGDIVPVD